MRGCSEWTGNQGCKIRLTTSGSSSQDGSATGAARPDTAHVTSPFHSCPRRLPSVALLASFTKNAGLLWSSRPNFPTLLIALSKRYGNSPCCQTILEFANTVSHDESVKQSCYSFAEYATCAPLPLLATLTHR